MIYLDTSALIKLYLLEEGSETVQRWVEEQADPLPIWELQESELLNALRLKVFWNDITKREAEDQIALFQRRKRQGFYFYPDISRNQLLGEFDELSRLHTPALGCRTLDIMHVACACQLQPEVFISFDQRQLSLAKRVGLPIRGDVN